MQPTTRLKFKIAYMLIITLGLVSVLGQILASDWTPFSILCAGSFIGALAFQHLMTAVAAWAGYISYIASAKEAARRDSTFNHRP